MASVLNTLFNKIRSASVKIDESSKVQNDETSGQLNELEYFLINVLKILVWDDPLLSCWYIFFVNIIFGFIIYFECKFYGIIFLTLLGLTLDQLWKELILPFFIEKNFNSQSSMFLRTFTNSELISFVKRGQAMIKDTYFNAKLLRQTDPGVFCLRICAYFLFLSFIGQNFSDFASSYIFIMFIMTVPGLCFRFLPPNIISTLSNFFYSSRKEEDEVEAYLPETNPESLELLRLAGELQLPVKEDEEESNDLFLEKISSRSNETTDSEYSRLSFYPDSPVMPSPENSMDFLDLDLPSAGHSERGSKNNDINFQSKHFDGESSDEEEFVKGLNLTEKSSKQTKAQINQSSSNAPSILNSENLIAIGANLLTAVVSQQKARDERESSSDTDSFEMISEEDM